MRSRLEKWRSQIDCGEGRRVRHDFNTLTLDCNAIYDSPAVVYNQYVQSGDMTLEYPRETST